MFKINKNFLLNGIIVCLSILSLICLFYLFSVLGKTQRNANDLYGVSCVTGNDLTFPHSKDNYIEVTYVNDNDKETLTGISKADMVFEYLNSVYLSTYNVVFFDNPPEHIKPIISSKDTSSSVSVNAKFSKDVKENFKLLNSLKAETIFVNFNDILSSNFTFNGEKYIHHKNTNADIDPLYKTSVKFDNIVILNVPDKNYIIKDSLNISDFESSGEGYLFQKGYYFKINWVKEKDDFFKLTNDSNEEVSLIKGNTWWVLAPSMTNLQIK